MANYLHFIYWFLGEHYVLIVSEIHIEKQLWSQPHIVYIMIIDPAIDWFEMYHIPMSETVSNSDNAARELFV